MRASEKLDPILKTPAGRAAIRRVLMGGRALVQIGGKWVQIGMKRSRQNSQARQASEISQVVGGGREGRSQGASDEPQPPSGDSQG